MLLTAQDQLDQIERQSSHAALAEELSKAIVQELHSSGETPSQRLNAEKSLRAALLRVFGED